MPLIKIKHPTPFATLIIWRIDEEVNDLQKGITLHEEEKKKYGNLHHPEKQKEFLALRQCLCSYFGSNPPIHYLENGKPTIVKGPKISFSHTQRYAAVIISKTVDVGIDLEYHRENIQRIATKFLRTEEAKVLSGTNKTAHITAYWGAKEVIVKIEGDRRLNFIKQIRIAPFLYQNKSDVHARLHLADGTVKSYSIYFEAYTDFYLTYGWERNWNWQNKPAYN